MFVTIKKAESWAFFFSNKVDLNQASCHFELFCLDNFGVNLKTK